jgi:signal transduction histidine kinase
MSKAGRPHGKDEELLLLQSIALDLDHCRTFERALERVVRRVCESTGWSIGEVWLPRSGGGYLERGPAWHREGPDLARFVHDSGTFRFARGEGLPGRVWKSRQPLWIRDVRSDSNFPRATLAREVGLKSGFAIPVLAGRRVVAVLNFFVLERRPRDLHLMRLVSAVAAQLGAIIRRTLTEEQLRVSRQAVAVQEAERRRLARELHDGVNQALSSARFRLKAMEESGDDRPGLAQTRSLVDCALQDLRRICKNLGSSQVEDLGLGGAVRRLVSDFEERTRILVTLSRDRFPARLGPELGSGLFRIVQEGLANVERHARASRVTLRLWREGGQLALTLRDDGIGFDPARPQALQDGHGGYGLRNLRERVSALGGKVGIASSPGKGTELDVRLPWRKA